MRTIALSAIVVGLFAVSQALAGDCQITGTCFSPAKNPGCHCGGQKVRKIVCEMKKVTKTVWAVECEEFCSLLPGRPTGRCCSKTACRDRQNCGGCDSYGNSGSCGKDPCKSVRSAGMVPPKCGSVRCKKKLVKKQIDCEVPVYKCVVVPCSSCCK